MKIFKKESNGYTLEVRIDSENLLKQLDEDIKEMKTLQAEIAEKGEETVAKEQGDNPDDYSDKYMADYRYNYNMQTVYGDPESDFCTPEEIINDREEFKRIINAFVESDGEELMNMVALKKNGTFKKTCKPLLKEAINGSYWDDSYGWNTLVLRIEPESDTVANVVLSNIVMHY